MAIPVTDYPDYLVYEDGRIWSRKTNKFLSPTPNKAGYKSVELFNETGSKRILVHRLVANAFIQNPLGLPQVNHKDENKGNNDVSNLEWCTAKYNMNYGEGAKTRHSKINYKSELRKEIAIRNGKKACVPVLMISKDKKVLARFESCKEASEKTGIYHTTISRAVNKPHLKAGGYYWRREGSDDLSVFQF